MKESRASASVHDEPIRLFGEPAELARALDAGSVTSAGSVSGRVLRPAETWTDVAMTAQLRMPPPVSDLGSLSQMSLPRSEECGRVILAHVLSGQPMQEPVQSGDPGIGLAEAIEDPVRRGLHERQRSHPLRTGQSELDEGSPTSGPPREVGGLHPRAFMVMNSDSRSTAAVYRASPRSPAEPSSLWMGCTLTVLRLVDRASASGVHDTHPVSPPELGGHSRGNGSAGCASARSIRPPVWTWLPTWTAGPYWSSCPHRVRAPDPPTLRSDRDGGVEHPGLEGRRR